MTTTFSKSERLAIAFATGAQLTARQIASRFKVANPYDMIYNLRKEGHNIELNTRTNSKGEAVNFYAIAPTKTSKRKAA